MDTDIKEELTTALNKLRATRKPNTRGIMLLTSFLASVMLTTGELKERSDSLEFIFWLTHNGDGTPITPNHTQTHEYTKISYILAKRSYCY
jgi:hypothetical protein